jgi:hypothetical protein
LAAIEIYNKPDFQYREETFAILMLNAWELLLKARIVKMSAGDFGSIEVWEPIKKKDGTDGKRRRRRKNRAGNTLTINIQEALGRVQRYPNPGIDKRCVANVILLMDIRDNAIHLHNMTGGLSQKVQEIGSATLRNFARAAEGWFDYNLDRFNFYIMPLAFQPPRSAIESLTFSQEGTAVRNLMAEISQAELMHPSDESEKFNVSMRIELHFVRTTNPDALPFRHSKDEGAFAVEVKEEDLRRMFPWDYHELIEQLGSRYGDFKQNSKFYDLKRKVEISEKHSRTRYLDPGNPKSTKKRFYSPGILGEFDKHYTRK